MFRGHCVQGTSGGPREGARGRVAGRPEGGWGACGRRGAGRAGLGRRRRRGGADEFSSEGFWREKLGSGARGVRGLLRKGRWEP